MAPARKPQTVPQAEASEPIVLKDTLVLCGCDTMVLVRLWDGKLQQWEELDPPRLPFSFEKHSCAEGVMGEKQEDEVNI